MTTESFDTYVRFAQAADVEQMVELSEQKRADYEIIQPVFWRKSENSRAVQTDFFHQLLDRENMLLLVHTAQGNAAKLDGFLIGALVPAPAVYDPGGLTCLIDDFCTADSEQWPTVGLALLQQAAEEAKTRGAIQLVVICGHEDSPKRTFLQEQGYAIISEWHRKSI